MTDDQQWRAPGEAVPPPMAPPVMQPAAQPAPQPVGQPAAQPVAPGYGPPPGGYGSPPGWTPPPKPGLTPLRPLTLGTILGAAFQMLRRNPGATLGPALLLSTVVAVIQGLGSAGFLSQYLGGLDDLGTSSSVPTGLVSGFLGLIVTSLGSGILSLIVTALVQAIVTVQVASSALGTRLRLGALWSRLRGRRGAVIGWAAITGGVVLVAIGIVAGLLVLIGSTGPAGVGIAVLLGLLLSAGLFVVFVWLWVKLGFVPTALVIDRTSILDSVRRSWWLTRGAFWRVLGIRLLVLAMIYIATNIVVTPISLIFSLGGVVLSPNGGTADSATNSLVLNVVITQAVSAVVAGVGLVLSTATTALLYLDQRMRREGLDLQLAQYVERRQAGEQGLADPYRVGPPPAGVA